MVDKDVATLDNRLLYSQSPMKEALIQLCNISIN